MRKFRCEDSVGCLPRFQWRFNRLASNSIRPPEPAANENHYWEPLSFSFSVYLSFFIFLIESFLFFLYFPQCFYHWNCRCGEIIKLCRPGGGWRARSVSRSLSLCLCLSLSLSFPLPLEFQSDFQRGSITLINAMVVAKTHSWRRVRTRVATRIERTY